MTIKILDDLYHLRYADLMENGQLTERGILIENALPALIRVARAAVKAQEEVLCVLDLDHPGDRVYLDELKEALQQLCDIGGENDRV